MRKCLFAMAFVSLILVGALMSACSSGAGLIPNRVIKDSDVKTNAEFIQEVVMGLNLPPNMIMKGDTVVLASLENTDRDLPVNYLIEDVLVHKLIGAEATVYERDPDAMSQLSVETPAGTKLPGAAKMLEYRVMRMGIEYMNEERSEGFGHNLYRIAEVELLVRIVYVSNGQIYWTGVLTNKSKEKIDEDLLPYYESDQLYLYYKDMPNAKKQDEKPTEPSEQ